MLAGTIHNSLVTLLNIDPKNVLFANTDRCSTNGAALNILRGLGEYINLLDGPCVSHTCNNCGEHTLKPGKTFNPDNIDPFLQVKELNRLLSSCLKNSTHVQQCFLKFVV